MAAGTGGRTGGVLTALMLLAACGGGGSTGGSVAVATPAVVTPAPTPTPTPTPTPVSSNTAAITAATTLDLDALANYATPTLPAYYDATIAGDDNTPADNPIVNRVATLGRVLFYDRRLSSSDTTACASCHQQASGFTDPRRFSTGVSGAAFTSAHAMRLGNVRYFRPASMFWDRRAATLELQASQPIRNAVEMGWTDALGGIDGLIAKMTAIQYYRDLFTFAFGSATITEARIQQALAQFQRAMVSSASKWDTGYAATFNAGAPNRGLNADLANFTAIENRGRQLFMTAPGAGGGAGCSACHQPPTYGLTANSQSNGLDAGQTIIFKSPSLKSVGIAGPYMHDGRFATLLEVVEHYNSGVALGPSLDNRLRQGNAPQRLNLSDADKAALVAFMLTLNDTALTGDPKFSDPFRR